MEHSIILNTRRLLPEDGLLLGNGDISVSIYPDVDVINLRFGKGDVWDRRLDYSVDPEPVGIDELTRGIEIERWKCGPYGGKVEALGEPPSDVQRVHEICQGAPKSYNNIPYPCPKPVGELQMFLPPDLPGAHFTLTLSIEKAQADILCEYDKDVRIRVAAKIHPEENLLKVDWSIENLTPNTLGHGGPVRFVLYRWRDPHIDEFTTKTYRLYDRSVMSGNGRVISRPPLEPPEAVTLGERWCVLQKFAPDLTYPKGFECLMTALGKADIAPVRALDQSAAGINIEPDDPYNGSLRVAIATTQLDGTRAAAQLESLIARAGTLDFEGDVLQAAKEFWGKSSLTLEDKAFERMWYETLHAQRCVYRSGKTAPGLMLPSTVSDYALWKGDYHMNYNFQQPFWGMPMANHPELMLPYMETLIDWFLPMGRMIAKKYYNCRGAFIQLTGFPMFPADDPIGVVPMGRMLYMTGWAVNQFWWYFRYTFDRKWLCDKGYPFMKECMIFLCDILMKGDDGLYHAFPSNQGEDGFDGKPDNYRDCQQVMEHIRYGFMVSIEAAKIAGEDAALVESWEDILQNLAPPRGQKWPDYGGLLRKRFELSPPEFGSIHSLYDGGEKLRTGRTETFPQSQERYGSNFGEWYFGATIQRHLMCRIRGSGGTAAARAWGSKRSFDADLDYDYFIRLITRWRRENGVCAGMSVRNHGHTGQWTEALGVTMPLQEMLLQSWDGAIALFPCWPLDVPAAYENFRAEGAFLVSASCGEGRIKSAVIQSMESGTCVLYPPWPEFEVRCGGQPVGADADDVGRSCFETEKGKVYNLEPVF
ncbi:MAG: hypothetical protein FWF05_00065 [Oscillospiraceae bacterium]|nr:hypothetical protein [Oscillospiraceae bacterium]